ncbi:5-formyltetrahydrofolate cyclo-ligase [Thiobacillus sp.]|uniref:5-formyltetrahydrofolate cyclo-ligase n=1 Tax=Thiobacillus sp. TaxID=924 RepID=UPI001DEA7196|nr:5-formyltetrahydrofolate cyclo-ligase [Thiobacillus sp.]MBC2760980.1 5-formyltetrahydrofolate cyclo-ligase [Thiobacillus sp.]
MDKTTLRRQLKAARSAFKPAERRHAARASLRLALRHGLLLRSQRIGFYLPQGGEFDAHLLLNQALCMQRECYLPILPRRGRVMRFGRVDRNTRMQPNRYGIPEPLDAKPQLWRKPRLIGIAYECQQAETLPHDPWDMPLDAVLTERRLHRFMSNPP